MKFLLFLLKANSEYINEDTFADIQENQNNNSESKTKTRYLDENSQEKKDNS